MFALYKSKEKICLLTYLPYRRLNFKKMILGDSNRLVPKLSFSRRGILFTYDLEECYVEGDLLMRRGAPLILLELWKEKP